MFNVGGGEFLVIMLVALIVLGPTKLPEAARQIGAMARELRRISSGFQQELRSALDEPVESQARDRGSRIVSTEQRPAPEPASDDSGAPAVEDDDPNLADDEVEPPMSSAEAAGMYDLVGREPDPAPDAPADQASAPPADDATSP